MGIKWIFTCEGCGEKIINIQYCRKCRMDYQTNRIYFNKICLKNEQNQQPITKETASTQSSNIEKTNT